MAKRRRKIKRTPPPWKSAIGIAALAHLVVIGGIIALSWQHFTSVHIGSVVFVHNVADSSEGAGDDLPSASGRDVVPPQPKKALSQANFPAAGSPPYRLGEGHPQLPDSSNTTNGTESGSNRENGESENRAGSSTIATGGGTGGGSGHAGTGDPTLAEIRRRIEAAKRYPAQARSMHQEGRVGVRFTILPNGQVAEVRVSQSSGTPALDDAAIQAVQRSTPLPAYGPPIDLSLAFRLR